MQLFNIKVISNPKFRYFAVIFLLGPEFLLLTEEFVSTMGKNPQATYI